MRRFLLRVVIALIAFAAGVTAATVFGGLLGWNSKSECRKAVYVAPPPPAAHACPNGLRLQLPAPPEPPAPPAAPLPPNATKHTSVGIVLPDGTLHIVETKTEVVKQTKK